LDLVDREAWLAADDKARLVWGFIETLDLGSLYNKVNAREGERPPADPAVQLLSGYWPRSKGWARRGSSTGSPGAILPTSGSPAGCRSTITDWPIPVERLIMRSPNPLSPGHNSVCGKYVPRDNR
jgi:hypothetical protein